MIKLVEDDFKQQMLDLRDKTKDAADSIRDTMYGRETTAQDTIKGGLADKLTPEQIAKKHSVPVSDIMNQLNMGLKVEQEHVGKDNDDKAREIALDHLSEIPDYYTRLDKMEKQAKKTEPSVKEAYDYDSSVDTMNPDEAAKHIQDLPQFVDSMISNITNEKSSEHATRLYKDGEFAYKAMIKQIYHDYDYFIDIIKSDLSEVFDNAKKERDKQIELITSDTYKKEFIDEFNKQKK